MSKIVIIEGNDNEKDQTRNYMVKGEKGDPGVSPTVETSKTGKISTIVITDAEGEHTVTVNDGEDGATANIIDSSTLSDNTTQTYSGRIADTRFVKTGDIAVITGNVTIDNNHSGLATISYPTGFTFSNTCVIGAYCDPLGAGIGFAPMTYLSWDSDYVNNKSVIKDSVIYALGTDGIGVSANGLNFTENQQIPYKIVLMKIS